MKLFLVTQDQNDDYDTYNGFVAAAPDIETARHMNPRTGKPMTQAEWDKIFSYWCSGPEYVTVMYIGEDTTDFGQRIILSSFRAG